MARNLAIGNVQVNNQPISTEPFSILAGEIFNLSWTVNNLGDEAIVGSGYGSAVNIDSIYLSDDNTLSSDDVEIGSYTNATNLGANVGAYNASLNSSILNGTLGSSYPLTNRYLIFKVNSGDNFAESNLADNITLVPITVNAIDLSLNSASVSVSGGGLDVTSLIGGGSPVNHRRTINRYFLECK
jgi:hypothetical protein